MSTPDRDTAQARGWQQEDRAWLPAVGSDGAQIALRIGDDEDDRPWVDEMGRELTDAEVTAAGAVLVATADGPARFAYTRDLLRQAIADRDRARAIAVALEQELAAVTGPTARQRRQETP